MAESDITVAYCVVGAITFIFNSIILTALRRTRRIPYATKLLSSGLLVFDMSFLLTSILRRLTADIEPVSVQLNVVGMSFVQLAYTTVAVMSLERFIVIKWPNSYLKHGSAQRIRFWVVIVWSSVTLLFLVIRYILCSAIFDPMLVLTTAGTCNQIVTIYYGVLVCTALCTSFVCYINIFKIIRAQNRTGTEHISFKSTARNFLKKYKTTSVVILYILVISLTSFAYVFVIVLIRKYNIDPSLIRTFTDSIHFANCILDPFLYVLWFRESQMECMKLVAPCSQRLQGKIEKMRIEVFSIVLQENHYHSTSTIA